MEKYEIIQRLESLNVQVQILEQARKDLTDKQYDYNAAVSSPPRNLLDFDAQNRDRYIAAKMGRVPKPLFAERFRSKKKKDKYANDLAD